MNGRLIMMNATNLERAMRASRILVVCVGVASAAAAFGHARSDPDRKSFDPESGRNLLNYPPHRQVDVQHVRLEIDIPDMNTPTMRVRQTLSAEPIVGDLGMLTLNGALLNVQSAQMAGRDVTFEIKPEQEVVQFTINPPVKPGEAFDLIVTYSVDNPPEGVVWTTESPAWPGRPALLYTQGESESNRYWFLSGDFPNDRFTSDVMVTVPTGYMASSNGREVRRVILGDRTRFDFSQDRPHVSYLVSLVVGKFDVVDVGNDRVPMPVYVPPGKGRLVKQTFGRTRDMIALFERITGVNYPWAKYAQVLVTNFNFGGMENTSATTLHEDALLPEEARGEEDSEGLIAHELAHQWYGDLLTCRSWEHIWLNEGFATYFENLWIQYKNSESSGSAIWDSQGDRDGYLAGVWDDFRSVIDRDRVEAPFQPPMVSKQYQHPDDVFQREANPYPKGASVLHMLRARLGDRTFFKALQHYTRSHADQGVETDQLRRAMEEASAQSLQRFFDQWCYRPGVPKVNVRVTWDQAASELVLNFEQTQRIDGDNPAFALDIPVWVRCSSDDSPRVVRATFDARETEVRMPLPSAPRMVVVDPDLTTLADLRVTQDTDRWLAQLASGPTIAARLQAASHLERDRDGDMDRVAQALARVAASSGAHVRLRERCLEALGHMGGVSSTTDDHAEHPCSKAALGELWAMAKSDLPREARVRAALVERLTQATSCATEEERVKIVVWLRDLVEQDKSSGVRAQAVKGVARLMGKEALEDVRSALSQVSHADRMRKAGLESLEVLDSPEAFALAMKYAGPGYAHSTRAHAARTVGKLSAHDPDKAYELLSVLCESREPSTAAAAVEALAGVDDARVRGFLQDRAASARGRTQRHQASEALGKIIKVP